MIIKKLISCVIQDQVRHNHVLQFSMSSVGGNFPELRLSAVLCHVVMPPQSHPPQRGSQINSIFS